MVIDSLSSLDTAKENENGGKGTIKNRQRVHHREGTAISEKYTIEFFICPSNLGNECPPLFFSSRMSRVSALAARLKFHSCHVKEAPGQRCTPRTVIFNAGLTLHVLLAPPVRATHLPSAGQG